MRRSCLIEQTTNRETQKNRLKRQIVSGQEEAAAAPKWRRPQLLLGILAVLLLLLTVFFFYQTNRHSTAYETAWEKSFDTGGRKADAFLGYETFGNGMIRYSKDGAAYYNADGKTIWERSYQMNAPVSSVSEKYAVIADQGGSSIYIFNENGNTGAVSTVRPVTKAVVADTGVVYAILQDEDAEYITAFQSDGTPIDLSVKSVITGDGYPVDIAVSPDGTQLITSYAAIENGAVTNKVIFRNFGEIGKNADARRIVGGFSDEFEGHMTGRVHFSDNSAAQAFYDGGIVFFSTKVLTSPAVLKKAAFADPIRSVAMSEDYVAVVLMRGQGGDPAEETAASADGKKTAQLPAVQTDRMRRAAGLFGAGAGSDVLEPAYRLAAAAQKAQEQPQGTGTEAEGSAEHVRAAAVQESSAKAQTQASGGSDEKTETSTAAEVRDKSDQKAKNDGEAKKTEEERPDTLYQLQIFNTKGQKIGEANFSFPYTDFEIVGSQVLLYSEDQLHIYEKNGRERAALELKAEKVQKTVPCKGAQGEYLVAGNDALSRIKLK